MLALLASGPAALPPASAAASSPSAARAACDLPAFATVLQPPSSVEGAPADEARAIWLDRMHLQWPGAPTAGPDGMPLQAVLAASARGRLQAVAGRPLAGADRALRLSTIAPATLPAATRLRFKYLEPGPVFAIAPADAAAVSALWRGPLRVVLRDAAGRVHAATGTQLAGALDDAYAGAAAGGSYGATVEGRRTGFRVWAPTAQAVRLCLYGDPQGAARAAPALRREADTGAWSLSIPADLSGRPYAFLVDVFVPGTGLVRNRVTDPYAVTLTADSRRSVVARLADPGLAPPGWAADKPPATVAAAPDMAIYELHVRDFSAADASVSAAHRGKYLAFTEADSLGMRHLRGLAAAGITDVHLLPVFDFATVPERGCVTPTIEPPAAGDSEGPQAAVTAAAAGDCFNWGYDPLHFGAPEGSYATDADTGATRVIEFRRMVQALHAAGLRVGMDVVYNHTSAAGQAAASVLDRIVPGYYQRLDARGAVEHSTCCANTATEQRMMARLMTDTVRRWAVDYHVDSFRFDLMAHQPRAAMQALQADVEAATGRPVHLIGEGWNFGEVADGRRFVQASQLSLNGSGIGSFSDRARDAIRGGSATDNSHPLADQGFINGQFYDPNGQGAATRAALLAAADLVRVGLAGSLRDYPMQTASGEVRTLAQIDYHGQPAGFASQPAEVVNYVENHDNQTLFDNNAYKLPRGTSADDRARVQILGAALDAFSQGIAYFHAGIELLRSKSMDRDSFDSGDWFNRLDWTLTDNGFAAGLPPRGANAAQWPLMRPLLADPSIKPAPAQIAWTSAAFADLLRLRASSSLFHLRTAADVRERLHFFNTGPDQEPTLIAGHLDGHGLAGANAGALLYFVNVDTRAHELLLPALRGQGWQLHPVHRRPDAADRRAAEGSRVDDASGRFTVPPRTAVVFVAP